MALEKFIAAGPSQKRYSLDRMRELMTFLGNPQDKIKTIHVAGTSGKTSTAYYCAALLTAAGHTVGLTVSPHVDKVSERAQINSTPLDDAVYCRELSLFLNLVERSGLMPSYFEVLVAFAFWEFDRQGVEYAVIEVGVGGLLDSTNVITRSDKVCVITDIGLDHVELLGETLGEIAAQKAGIIHPGNTVFMYKQSAEVHHSVQKVCSRVSAKLIVVKPSKKLLENLAHLPQFQQRNFNLALRATQCMLGISLSTTQIKEATGVYIPARAEYISYLHKTLILDGSHNPQKLTALAESVEAEHNNTTKALLVSFGENKTISLEDNLRILHRLSNSIILTAFSLGEGNPRRAINPYEICAIAERVGFTDTIVELNPQKALDILMKRGEKLAIVTGSFYLLNHIRPIVRSTVVL